VVISGYGAVLSASNLITGNTVHDNDAAGISVQGCTSDPGGGIACPNNIIELNETYNNNSRVDDFAGIWLCEAGTGNIVRYNRSHNNGTAIYRGAGIMLDSSSLSIDCHHNKCYFNTNGGITNGSSGHSVSQNTLYHNDEQGWDVGEICLFGGASGLMILSNIMQASAGKHVIRAFAGTGGFADYNCYYADLALPFDLFGTDLNFTTWKALTIIDLHSLFEDPQLDLTDFFSKNYRLKGAGSGGADIGAGDIIVPQGDAISYSRRRDAVFFSRPISKW